MVATNATRIFREKISNVNAVGAAQFNGWHLFDSIICNSMNYNLMCGYRWVSFLKLLNSSAMNHLNPSPWFISLYPSLPVPIEIGPGFYPAPDSYGTTRQAHHSRRR